MDRFYEINAEPIVHTPLLNNQAFILDNLFNQEQCNILISKFEADPTKCHVMDDGYDIQYRDNTRVIFDDDKLAQYLFNRISPYLSPMEISEKSMEVSVDKYSYGTWTPNAVNEKFRLCKYDVNGLFKPHRDGFFEKDFNNRTFQTLMLYLNEDFDGGCTRFLEKINEPIIKPKIGRAIIFDHYILHEGEKLASNKKYIIRSDIMFKREGEATEKMVKMFDFKKRAIEYEDVKDFDNAAKMYRQISKLEGY
jgi:prolyl 4-hydroxylase